MTKPSGKILAKEKPIKEIPDYKKDDDKSFEEIMRAYGKIK